jgi:hypothetical protein
MSKFCPAQLRRKSSKTKQNIHSMIQQKKRRELFFSRNFVVNLLLNHCSNNTSLIYSFDFFETGSTQILLQHSG